MITLMWVALAVFAVFAVAAIIAGVWAVLREKYDEPEHPGFSDIQRPTEIAHEPPRRSIHELPPLGDAVWHQYPVTSPAAGVATGAPAGPGPGTAAAAGGLPGSPPPPLPDPAYAAANPTAYPLAWLLSDTFVGRVEAIRKGGAP